MKEKFSVTGMTCSACSAGIERTVKKLNGINFVSVSLMGESMSVEYDESLVSRDNIIQTVKSLGYDAFLYDESALTKKKPQPRRFPSAVFPSLPIPAEQLLPGWFMTAVTPSASTMGKPNPKCRSSKAPLQRSTTPIAPN